MAKLSKVAADINRDKTRYRLCVVDLDTKTIESIVFAEIVDCIRGSSYQRIVHAYDREIGAIEFIHEKLKANLDEAEIFSSNPQTGTLTFSSKSVAEWRQVRRIEDLAGGVKIDHLILTIETAKTWRLEKSFWLNLMNIADRSLVFIGNASEVDLDLELLESMEWMVFRESMGC